MRIHLSALLPVVAHGWTDTGHMLTAKIAALGLSEDALNFVQNMTSNLFTASDLSGRHGEWNAEPFDSLVGVAVWMDSLNQAFDFSFGWHFSDVTIALDSGCKLSESKNVKSDQMLRKSISSGHLEELTEAEQREVQREVVQDVVYSLSHAYFGITAEFDEKWGDPALHGFQQAYWMRALVHFMGDIHQPLHCANGCSAKHPDGDMGGNLFLIKTNITNTWRDHNTTVGELHLLWDLVGGLYAAGPNWPLNQDGFKTVTNDAVRLRNEFSSEFGSEVDRIVNLNASNLVDELARIRDESTSLAKSDAYGKGLVEDAEVPLAYIENAQKVALRRIALGGFRLQGMLEKVYRTLKGRSEKMREVIV